MTLKSIANVLWQRWRKGSQSPRCNTATYAVIGSFLCLVWTFGPTYGLVNYSVTAAFVIIMLPFFVCGILLPIIESDRSDPRIDRKRIVDELSSKVESILSNLDSRADLHRLETIGSMIQSNQTEAVKSYRNSIGVTWDQADAAIKDWPMTMLKAKLDAIKKAVSERKAELV